MAGKTLVVPSFDYSAFYYPQILDALIAFKRGNIPELTDESDEEPSMQMLRAFACVGHLNSVLIDMVANENTIVTAKLASTIRNMLRLIGYELKTATPSQVDIVYKLSSTLAASTVVVTEWAQAATKRDGDNPIIYFEADSDVTVDATDEIGIAIFENSSGTYTDCTSSAQGGTSWPSAGNVAATGVKYYFGHSDVMFDKLSVDIGTASTITNGVWEYYDSAAYTHSPDTATSAGGGLIRFNLNSLLGEQNRTGALVRVWLNSTQESADLYSMWDGTNNYILSTSLGQTTPSYVTTDYTVGTYWTELSNVSDGTSMLASSGDVEYDIPQTSVNNWGKVTINSVTGYMIRFRVISNAAPSTGPYMALCNIDGGKQYVLCNAVQGRSVIGETLGSSNGSPKQSFETGNKYFIYGSEEVRVNGTAWTRVDNFLNSYPADTHYKVELSDYDKATIVFGDGNNGKIPDVGQNNIIIDYRFGANDSGNVGASTISVDKSGLSFVEAIWNPRAAIGWAEAESASTESLEQAKLSGPESLTAREVAIGPDDVVLMATKTYKDDSGSCPFSRAIVVEEAFGLKTMELIVLAKGGGQATEPQLTSLSTWFNGDKYSLPQKPKRLVANQQITASNSTTRTIDVTATVTAPASVTKDMIKNQLLNVLQPEAKKDGGIDFVWNFGDLINPSRIQNEIFSAGGGAITNVSMTSPAAPIQLGSRELPKAGTITITVINP